MKDRRMYDGRLLAAVLALATTIMALLGSESLETLPLALQLILPFMLGGVVFVIFESALRKSLNSEIQTNGTLLKTISSAVLLAVLLSTFAATKSLWYSPFADNYGYRFTYENIATAAGFSSIVLTLILSTLQKDIYWVSRIKTVKFDERLIKERQEVFETSYKLGTFLILGATWFYSNTIHNIPNILANHSGTVPGHLIWLPLNIAIILFALPLTIAAWRKK